MTRFRSLCSPWLVQVSTSLLLLFSIWFSALAEAAEDFSVSSQTRSEFGIPDLFKQGLDAHGIPVVATSDVPVGKLLEAALFLQSLCQAQPDLANTLKEGRHYVGLVSNTDQLAAHPDWSKQSASDIEGWPISDNSKSIVWIAPSPSSPTGATTGQDDGESAPHAVSALESWWHQSLTHLGHNSSLPIEYSTTLSREASQNASQLARAWSECRPNCRAGLNFLLEHMTAADRQSLSSAYLLEHVHLAYESWEQAPWKAQVTEAMFFDWILPYVNVNESRDAWRADFRKRFSPFVQGAKTPGEAATLLNQKIFGILDVRYSTQRRRPDQGPYESIETHLASCSGLSILLIDACRSVGIPARFVGTPRWSDNSGNHSWVEVWSDGNWHFTGACEPAGDRLDEGWFIGRASEAKADDPRYAIYAASFRRTPIHFPLVWNMRDKSVYGINITQRYLKQDRSLEEGQARIRFCVRDAKTNARLVTQITLKDDEGKVILEGKSRDDGFDSNDHLEVVVMLGTPYEVFIDGEPTQTIQALAPNQLFTFHVE